MKLFFLSYINRSGSSFLSELLSRYNDIFVFPEGCALINEFLLKESVRQEDYFLVLRTLFFKDAKLKEYNLTINEIQKISQLSTKEQVFLEILNIYKNRYKPNAKVLIFKKENIYAEYQKILKILKISKPRLICLWRDPRSIFNSQKTTIDPYMKRPFNTNPLITASLWVSYMKYIESNHCISVQYEMLLNDSERILSELLIKIGVSNMEQSDEITYWKILPKIQQYLHSDIKQTAKEECVTKWSRYLTDYERCIIEQKCKCYMEKQNYFLIKKKCPVLNFLYKLIVFIKMQISIVRYGQ